MDATRETLRVNKLDNAYIRPLAYVGNVGLGVCPPVGTEMDLMIAAFRRGLPRCRSARKWRGCHGFQLASCGTEHHSNRGKEGGNYLSSLLVGGEARRHGYAEGIALSVDGYLSKGAGENIFVVKPP